MISISSEASERFDMLLGGLITYVMTACSDRARFPVQAFERYYIRVGFAVHRDGVVRGIEIAPFRLLYVLYPPYNHMSPMRCCDAVFLLQASYSRIKKN
jgi:hypothetical protein